MNSQRPVHPVENVSVPLPPRALWFWGLFPGFFRRACEARVREQSLIGQVLRRWRRFFLGSFFPDYVKASIQATRKGECHRCGLCCQLIYKCPFLGRDSQNLPYCRIYGDLRPSNCHSYPFDQVDAEVEQCGFSFVDPKKGP